jgi:uncharacterized protein YfaS (alpha-2-macroglobulin family)
VQPLSQGIVVDRHFEITQPITTANVGDVISITLRVVITRELQHALFELPLPAGTEPVDLRLATESPNLVDNPALGRTWTTADGFSAES